jgi:hypothetical protein
MYCRKPMYFMVLAILFAFSAKSYAVAYLGVVLGQPSDDTKGAVVANVIDGSPAVEEEGSHLLPLQSRLLRYDGSTFRHSSSSWCVIF